MNAVINTEKLTKWYGPHRGIVEVDLEIAQGEIFGFLGPNGAGKTTTIRVLLDLIRPTSGVARVFDIVSNEDPVAIHRRIGYVPGEFALYDRLTGKQTLEYFANLRGGVDKEYQQSLIERFELDPSRRFREYCKGNKQKVGVIIALQHKPELLILDEPTSGLDPLVQQTFFTTLREAVKDGATVFLSSHILSEVERAATGSAIIREGRIAQLDTVEGLRDLAHHQVELRFAGPFRSPRSRRCRGSAMSRPTTTSCGCASPGRSRRSSAPPRSTSCSTSFRASRRSRKRSSPSTAVRPPR